MRVTKLKEAIIEAERFIKAANKCLTGNKCSDQLYSSKETGSAKRASMDLTRKLAELRKP